MSSWPQLPPTGIRVPSGNSQYTCIYVLNSKHQAAMLRTSGNVRARAAGHAGRPDPPGIQCSVPLLSGTLQGCPRLSR